MKYNVLWIDDQPSEEFMCVAYDDFGLNIINKTCYVEGLKWLKENQSNCYGVILDVNCKVEDTEDENASMEAFTEYHRDIIELCSSPFIPWYIYTAGDYEGVEALERIIPNRSRWWDDRKYYNKPSEGELLLSKVQLVASRHQYYSVINEYDDVFTKFSNVQEKLLKILLVVYKGDTRDSRVYNDIRKVLEKAVIPYLYNHGLLPADVTKISQVGPYLSKLNKADSNLVPKFISYGWGAFAETTQNGSHDSEEGKGNLIVEELTIKGKMPYLIRSTVFGFLNFLIWASMLPQTEEGIDNLRKRIESFNIK